MKEFERKIYITVGLFKKYYSGTTMLGKGFEIPLTEFRKKGEIMKQPHTFGIREVEKSRNTAVTQ